MTSGGGGFLGQRRPVQPYRGADRRWLQLLRTLHHVAPCHALDRRQERELVLEWLECCRIDEQRRAVIAACAFQRQRDQVPKAAPGQVVLRREEPVVALHAHLAADCHCLAQQRGPHGARIDSGDRLGEERPHVRALARPRDLESGGDTCPCRCFRVGGGVKPPRAAVEVTDQQPAGAIGQHHVESAGGGVVLRQVRGDDVVGERQVLRVVAGGAGPPFRRPALGTVRGIFPPVRVYIVAAREESLAVALLYGPTVLL